MRRDLLTIAVILTVASGCDNAEWSGLEFSLESPPPKADLIADNPALGAVTAEAEEPSIELPEGPILLAGVRNGSRATLTIVGEVQGDGFAALPSEDAMPGFGAAFAEAWLAPGAEWVLFSQGARIGRLTTDEVGTDERYCTPRPTVSGTVELVPGSGAPTRLLALPASLAHERDFSTNPALGHDYDQRVASLGLATEAIPRVGAVWPPDGVLSIRSDIRAFQLQGESGPSIAATFNFRQGVDLGAPRTGAYSLFVMGSHAGGPNYTSSFVGYRASDAEGKAVPRYFDHLDLDGDGSAEVILDVFGEGSRWFSTLSKRSGSWVRTSLEDCSAR